MSSKTIIHMNKDIKNRSTTKRKDATHIYDILNYCLDKAFMYK